MNSRSWTNGENFAIGDAGVSNGRRGVRERARRKRERETVAAHVQTLGDFEPLFNVCDRARAREATSDAVTVGKSKRERHDSVARVGLFGESRDVDVHLRLFVSQARGDRGFDGRIATFDLF